MGRGQRNLRFWDESGPALLTLEAISSELSRVGLEGPLNFQKGITNTPVHVQLCNFVDWYFVLHSMYGKSRNNHINQDFWDILIRKKNSKFSLLPHPWGKTETPPGAKGRTSHFGHRRCEFLYDIMHNYKFTPSKPIFSPKSILGLTWTRYP